MPPHSLPLTLLGTGILWFGWFGFNAGSALAANGVAAQAFMNTFLAAAAAMLGWLVVERLKDGHATTLGAASGAVAGLVAITPCAGFVGGMAPIVIGVDRRRRLLPRARPEVPVRLRRLARRRRRAPRRRPRRLAPARASSPTRPINAAVVNDGVFFGGGVRAARRPGRRRRSSTLVFSFVVTLHHRPRSSTSTMGLRRRPRTTRTMGLDLSQHAETAYADRLRSTPTMKLITAIIKPFKLDDVKDALKDAGVAGHDRHRGAGLRPPGGSHRGVPRRRVHDRLRAEGARSRSLSTTPTSTAIVDAIVERGRDRQDRRRQGLGHRRRTASCASAPASATPTPSDSSKAETVRARDVIAALRARRSSMLSPELIERGRR